MMQKALAASTALLIGTTPALGQTVLPLNTGYDHALSAPYGTPASQPSNIRDDFWIKIASYEPPSSSTTVSEAWVLSQTWGPWAFPLTTTLTTPASPSRWIGPRPVAASSPGASITNPAYSIFRKCFCLMQGFKDPTISFDIRGDDQIHVWLNTVTQTLLAPVIGNWGGGQPRKSLPSSPGMFRVGPNCLYVLLEDNYHPGQMGFDLAGAVSAWSLMPMPAKGTNASFEPCACRATGPGTAAGAGGARHDDSAVLQAIVNYAETRRKGRAQRIMTASRQR